MPPRLLVIASETSEQEEGRRRSAGASSAETFSDTLRKLVPQARIDLTSCFENAAPMSVRELKTYDAAFFAGSPISMHERTPETEAAVAFMLRIFESGTPAFGSCAGLQIAAVAAGGTCKPREPSQEAGFARGIVATDDGRAHPLLKGRPFAWDAPTNHADQIASLPPSARVLARTDKTPVQAAEIRHLNGVFWGVQYHPELTLEEIAIALRREADDLVEQGLAADKESLFEHAARIEALGREPHRTDLAWQLGLDEEVTDPGRRMIELSNFIDAFVGPGRARHDAGVLEATS